MSWALVTGGTSGIGATYARHLAAAGMNVVLVARDKDRLRATAKDLTETFGVEVETISADLAVREDVGRVAQRLESGDRPIEVFVNNAGFGIRSKLLDPDTSVQERAIDVMITAVLVLGGAAARGMVARGRGHIANISSISGWIAQGNYSAIKAWVRVYSESLSNELHGTGVTATAVCPGWVKTEFHQRAEIKANYPDWVWIDADVLVRESLKDILAGKVYSVPTLRWKAARLVVGHGPRALIGVISRMLAKSRE
jgi:short-subunit dehydrogenase